MPGQQSTQPVSAYLLLLILGFLPIIIVAAIQNESFRASGIRRLFLALNYAQVITIGLTCAMIVTEAVGFPYRIRHVIPATAALMLAIAAILCLRIARGSA